MRHTTESRKTRKPVTATAAALIKATSSASDALKLTAPHYGHDNREIIERVWLDKAAALR